MPKNSGSMPHRFSVLSYDPRNVWFTIFGYVTATLATFFVDRDAENTEAELASEKRKCRHERMDVHLAMMVSKGRPANLQGSFSFQFIEQFLFQIANPDGIDC